MLVLAALATLAIPTVPNDPPLDPRSAAGWTTSASCALGWDVVHGHPATEVTTVHTTTDGKFLYVRFDATQAEPIAASQHSDDVGQGSDDAVWVDLWPTGAGGFYYQFQATPIGTHYEASSENTAFSPHWQTQGAIIGNGYSVTMAIPLGVVRGAHAGNWKAQFVRYVHATGEEDVWSYDQTQTNPDDYARAGNISLPFAAGAGPARPRPRAAIYALGLSTTPAYGGSTSRVGADVSIPITPTASFFSTFHPDYSNVELDQQSISPTVYQRIYSEVRPFFTQANQFYNNFNCDACSGYRTILYTPNIPTPAQGYAVEGKQGNFGFAAFDSIGDDRTDIASALDYTSPDTKWNSSYMRVAANVPGTTDVAQELGTSWYDLKRLSFYVNVGNETGSDVANPSQAQFIDAGGGWQNQHFGVFGSVRNVGPEFNPYDGFVAHAGIAGYGLYMARIWDFSPNDKLASAGIGGFVDRYQGPQYGQAQSDNSLQLDILTKSAWDFQLLTGSDYWRFGQTLSPISQNAGFSITYHSGLQTNNPGQFPAHGTSATPTQLQYFTGAYGNGRLDTWFRTSTIRVGDRGALSIAIDNTAQWMRYGADNIQWFDSVSYTFQISRDSSIAFGVRKIIGYPPQPNGGGNCAGTCSNVSIAYHLRLKRYEFYVAYGNPNTLTTVPQAIFKVIFYAGGEKGV